MSADIFCLEIIIVFLFLSACWHFDEIIYVCPELGGTGDIILSMCWIIFSWHDLSGHIYVCVLRLVKLYWDWWNCWYLLDRVIMACVSGSIALSRHQKIRPGCIGWALKIFIVIFFRRNVFFPQDIYCDFNVWFFSPMVQVCLCKIYGNGAFWRSTFLVISILFFCSVLHILSQKVVSGIRLLNRKCRKQTGKRLWTPSLPLQFIVLKMEFLD